jgi:hypothetical protein
MPSASSFRNRISNRNFSPLLIENSAKRTRAIKALLGNQHAKQVDLPIRSPGLLPHLRNQDCRYFSDDIERVNRADRSQ